MTVSSARVSDGLVMVCDVDLAVPDATRVHTVEVARNFAAEGLAVDLVARGPDPEVDGVRYLQGQGADSQRLTRVATLNAGVLRLLWSRRMVAKRLYVRYRCSLMPVLIAGRLLGYRVVTQVDDIPYGRGYQFEISPVADHVQRLGTTLMGRLARGVVAVTPELKRLLVEQFHAPPGGSRCSPTASTSTSSRPSRGPRRSAGSDSTRRRATWCSAATSPHGSTSTRSSGGSGWSPGTGPTSGCCWSARGASASRSSG